MASFFARAARLRTYARPALVAGAAAAATGTCVLHSACQPSL